MSVTFERAVLRIKACIMLWERVLFPPDNAIQEREDAAGTDYAERGGEQRNRL